MTTANDMVQRIYGDVVNTALQAVHPQATVATFEPIPGTILVDVLPPREVLSEMEDGRKLVVPKEFAKKQSIGWVLRTPPQEPYFEIGDLVVFPEGAGELVDLGDGKAYALLKTVGDESDVQGRWPRKIFVDKP